MCELSKMNGLSAPTQKLRNEEAVVRFEDGFSCSQAVFATYAAELGLDETTALKVAAPFSGGMGRSGGHCGAVTGALMALGLAAGTTNPQDKAGKDKVYALTYEFIERFRALHGAISCPELLEADISTPEGLQKARDTGAFKTKCPSFVRDTAMILEHHLQH